MAEYSPNIHAKRKKHVIRLKNMWKGIRVAAVSRRDDRPPVFVAETDDPEIAVKAILSSRAAGEARRAGKKAQKTQKTSPAQFQH